MDNSAKDAARFLAKMVNGGGSPITQGPIEETTSARGARAGGGGGGGGGGARGGRGSG
jgi:hypothetical protein